MRTRIIVGTLMAALAACMLFADLFLEPTYPFLLIVVLLLAAAACSELHRLLAAVPHRPPFWLCAGGVLAVLLANWPVHILVHLAGAARVKELGVDPWQFVVFTFAAVAMVAFAVEIPRYRDVPGAVPRVALALFFVAYLGLLPSFFVQLRWPPPDSGGLTMAIFVPKCGDIAAYFTGRFFGGRFLGPHRMAPVLSPKKTWEGFAGGMVGAAAAAVALDFFHLDKDAVQRGDFMHLLSPHPVMIGGVWTALGFGVTVGLVGVVGDLAESLIKRDCRRKDASQTVPGFGGVLDVIDSVVFAAPVAYLWLRWLYWRPV
jgi:phosphatidate cytidylyltransferase